jgi:uncharacterized damage-inducible protein DinB
MKELLTQYATYNIWANNEILNVILSLTNEQQKQEITSSFSSIYNTCYHLYDAESIWYQRLQQVEKMIRQSENQAATMQDVANGWQQQSRLWLDWIGNVSEEQLKEIFHYQNMKGEKFQQPLQEVLLHLFNHSTYHRGQLVTMLRQVGVEKIPATDFVHWARTMK